jgi:hypothetical protein
MKKKSCRISKQDFVVERHQCLSADVVDGRNTICLFWEYFLDSSQHPIYSQLGRY